MSNKKRILVTGGAGFIGSHLCDVLVKQDHQVFCVDNLLSGTLENVNHLLNLENFVFIQHDITAPLFLEVDEIYNLACPASPIQYQKNAIKTIKISVVGSLNMLGLARKNGAKILQASTSEIYGDPHIHPQTEQYWGHVNPIGDRSCYNEGKRCAEALFVNYLNQHNVDIKIARIFNTYGPRMLTNDGRVISNFISQALNNNPITIFGEGSQTRSFCYILDMVTALILLMDSDYSKPVNLGNTCEISIYSLAKKIIALTNSSSDLVYKPLPMDDPTQRKPSIELAKSILKWVPTISIEEGLTSTIEVFKKNKIILN